MLHTTPMAVPPRHPHGTDFRLWLMERLAGLALAQ